MRRVAGPILALLGASAVARGAFTASRAAERLLAEGNVEYRQLRFAEALAKYDAALKAAPDYALAYNNRGLALHKLGRLNEAEAALRKAVELDDEKAAFHLNLSKVLASAGDYVGALKAVRRVRDLVGGSAAAMYNRVWILDEAGRDREACEAAAELERTKAPPPGTKMLAAIVEAKAGSAAKMAEACLNVDDLPRIWQWLGRLNQALGTGGAKDLSPSARLSLKRALTAISTEQFAAARKYLSATAAQAGASPIPPWLTAMTWLLEGKSEKGAAAMERAVALMPRVGLGRMPGKVFLFASRRFLGCAPLEQRLLPGTYAFVAVGHEDGNLQSLTDCIYLAPGQYYTPPVSRLASVKFRILPGLEPVSQGELPDALTLAPGSLKAQGAQLLASADARLPLEVRTAKTGMRFRLIPPGTFCMGSPAGEKDRYSDEVPHPVKLPRAFYCGVFEVTQGQWELVMGSNSVQCTKAGARAPVTNVSWNDCREFLKKLCALEGVSQGTFDLPAEAEWEYACRAGTETRFYWGDDPDAFDIDEFAWYRGNSKGRIHRVGAKRPNAWGLCDMSGNVWEWCRDLYGDYREDGGMDLSDIARWVSERVRRGGGCASPPEYCRSALRFRNSPSTRRKQLGFRVVRRLR